MTDARVYNVLFLCTGNSCRSILGEAILDRVGGGKFKAYSAGSFPKGDVNPHAIALLKRLNHTTEGLRSKSWDEFVLANNPDAPKLDFVFTVCDNAAGEVCPVWPGQPMTAHWGMADPGEVQGTDAEISLAFMDAYRQLTSRLGIFAALPIASLDRMSLQQRMNAIGKSQDTAAHAQ